MTTLTWTVGTETEHAAAVGTLIGAGWKFIPRHESLVSQPGTSLWAKGRVAYVVITNALYR